MIVCPNCNHSNPVGAIQCEACYTPLPAIAQCPNCGASVQTDASFCGQCGFNLKTVAISSPLTPENTMPNAIVESSLGFSQPAYSAPLPEPEPMGSDAALISEVLTPPAPVPETTPPLSAISEPAAVVEPSEPPVEVSTISQASEISGRVEAKTQLQSQNARLLHVQTNSSVELPQNVSVVHLGKPNDRIPPDVDVSGFPNSEIVSRIHADIRIEGDAYYIEDVGSSNGTYINNLPLPMGNRHRLRSGDRIALGKGDKVTFLFQLS